MTDELKPVKCGCGGEAKVQGLNGGERWFVFCRQCHTDSDIYDTVAEAIQAWNRAMGAGKDEIAITKGYWMATYDGLHCSVCNYKCETTALPEVCPHCGTRLIRW